MLGLPPSVSIRKAIPKDAFFRSRNITGPEKRRFDEQVHKLTVIGLISPDTVNIDPGSGIEAIYVMEVQLSARIYEPKIIDSLERLGHKTVYVLKYGEWQQIAVKEGLFFCSEWDNAGALSLKLVGFNLAEVWANIVRGIGSLSEEGDFEDTVRTAVENDKVSKQIEALEKKMAKEKQNHVKRELFAQIRELKSKLK